jgi:hypothetical protein
VKDGRLEARRVAVLALPQAGNWALFLHVESLAVVSTLSQGDSHDT